MLVPVNDIREVVVIITNIIVQSKKCYLEAAERGNKRILRCWWSSITVF